MFRPLLVGYFVIFGQKCILNYSHIIGWADADSGILKGSHTKLEIRNGTATALPHYGGSRRLLNVLLQLFASCASLKKRLKCLALPPWSTFIMHLAKFSKLNPFCKFLWNILPRVYFLHLSPKVQKYQNLREVSCKNMYEIKKIYNIKNILINIKSSIIEVLEIRIPQHPFLLCLEQYF